MPKRTIIDLTGPKYPPRSKKGRFSPSLPKRVAKLERAVEHKSKDFAVKSSYISPTKYFTPTGQIEVLNDMGQGDTLDTREGRRASMESLTMRYQIRINDVGGGLANYRLMIVWDKYPNNGVATADEILDFSTVIDGEEALAMPNLGNRERFQILYDDTNGIAPGKGIKQVYGTSGGNLECDFSQKHYLKINKQSIWGGDLETLPTTGALLLVTVGNKFGDATQVPIHAWTGVFRTRFTDS